MNLLIRLETSRATTEPTTSDVWLANHTMGVLLIDPRLCNPKIQAAIDAVEAALFIHVPYQPSVRE